MLASAPRRRLHVSTEIQRRRACALESETVFIKREGIASAELPLDVDVDQCVDIGIREFPG